MPSKGTPIKTLRVPLDLVARIEQAIDSANMYRYEIPYDWSSWALKALREKLAHLERGRSSGRSRRTRRAADSGLSPAVEVLA